MSDSAPDSATKSAMVARLAENPWLDLPNLSAAAQSRFDLSVDQPTIALDPAIIDYAAAQLEAGLTHYADVPGVMELRRKLTGFLATVGMPDVEAGQILVTAGVQESRFLAMQMVGANFASIGVPEVVHPGVHQALAVRPRNTVEIHTAADGGRYLPELDELRRILQTGCRLLYLESPSRLTGAAYTAAEVRAIADLVREHDAAVIWDQGLAPWVKSGVYASLGGQADMADRVVTVGEALPGMGLESWNVGYLTAKAEWLEQVRAQKQIMSICTSVATQFAAVHASELYVEAHSGHLEVLGEQRHAMVSRLQELGGRILPGEAANVIALEPEAALVERLRTAGIAYASGVEFGAPDVLRVSVPLQVTPDEVGAQLT